MGLMFLTAGLIGQWLLGVFVATRILSFRQSSKPSIAELVGLGCVLGVGVTACSLFLWSFLGGSLGIWPSGVLTVIGFLTGVPTLVFQLRQAWAEPVSSDAVGRTCQTLVTILVIACVLQTLQTPQKLWDERAIFALKARVLFEDRSIYSVALSHPDFVQYHPRYPLLLPLAEEHIYALLGVVDDRLSKLVFSLLYCGLVLSATGVLQRYFTSGRAWLGTLILATVPVMMPYEYGFLCGQADAPVACYHGVSVMYLWDGLRRQQRGESCLGSIVVAGLCGGLAAFTKDEGIAYLMIDAAILGLFSLVAFFKAVPGTTSVLARVRSPLESMTVFLAAVATVLVPWFLHRRHLPNTTEMNYFGRISVTLFLSRLDTLGWSVPHLLRRMFWEWREWGLQWWFMLAGFISRPTRAFQSPQLLLILDVVGSLTSLLVAGMVAPAQLDEHIGGSSHRFLMQIAPVGVLFALTQFFSDKSEE